VRRSRVTYAHFTNRDDGLLQEGQEMSSTRMSLIILKSCKKKKRRRGLKINDRRNHG
jgi:hypothetical protein